MLLPAEKTNNGISCECTASDIYHLPEGIHLFSSHVMELRCHATNFFINKNEEKKNKLLPYVQECAERETRGELFCLRTHQLPNKCGRAAFSNIKTSMLLKLALLPKLDKHELTMGAKKVVCLIAKRKKAHRSIFPQAFRLKSKVADKKYSISKYTFFLSYFPPPDLPFLCC